MDEAEASISLAGPLSKGLYDYWNALRNTRRIPYRREIEPGRLSALLPHLVLLEQTAGGPAIFRLAGTAICTAFGRELRDHTLVSLWRAADRFLIEGAISTALSQAAAALLSFEAMALERPPVEGEMALLPLLDERGAPTRLIGAVSFAPKPAHLAPKPYTRLELRSVARIAPARDRVVLKTAPRTPSRPALALVQGGAARGQPSLTRPWNGRLREIWQEEQRDEERDV